MKDLLDVADVLNRAVSAGNGAENKNNSMFEGLKLTESQLLQVFKRHGLEQVNPLNEKFDPNKHEALFQIPNPSVDANTVLDVQKIGYQLHGRTIRPALVGVSKKWWRHQVAFYLDWKSRCFASASKRQLEMFCYHLNNKYSIILKTAFFLL